MVAALSVQWLAIAVAAVVVIILLAVILLRNRREDARLMATAPPTPAAVGSPGGSFLDQPLSRGFEGLGKPVAAAMATKPWVAAPLARPEPIDPFASHDDLFPTPPEAAPAETRPAPVASAPATTEPPAPAGSAPGAPLSDIIVTSDRDAIDLGDPEVRAMLAELLEDEIALARVQRDAGETLDAILQLTEAERSATALAAEDKVADIRALLGELQP
jgi:hypothetical protein